MANKIALINMKGGVGKSTLSVNLAWHFAGTRPWVKKVLVIDSDPQFNASQYLLGGNRYQQEVFKAKRPTIWNIFESMTRIPGHDSVSDLSQAIIRVIQFTDGSLIDLIPSQLELCYSLKQPGQKEGLLASFVKGVEKNYDLIIIDCAPTESILTTAAYLTVDKILVPVKPEYLSTIGLPLLVQSMNEFTRQYRKKLEMVGVVFNACTGYAPEERSSKKEVKALSAEFGWHIFGSEVPYSRSFPKGAREGEPIFRTSYSHTTVKQRFSAFAHDFAKRAGI